jgi:hypothetical protein
MRETELSRDRAADLRVGVSESGGEQREGRAPSLTSCLLEQVGPQ